MILKKLLFAFMAVVAVTGQTFAGEIIRINKNNLHLLPAGKEVDGMIGDWIIKNNKVIAVIGNASPDREANQMVSSVQGAVLDFTKLNDNNDQLTVYYPQGARIDVRSADTVIVVSPGGQRVQLKVIKYATRKEPFIAETIYTLRDDDDYLEVTTTYTNPSNKAVNVLVYDVLRCDNRLEDITPPGENRLAYVYNKWYHSAYGIFSKDRTLYTPSGSMKKNLVAQGHRIFFNGVSKNPQDSAVLLAGQALTISRYLFTGTDISELRNQPMVQQAQKHHLLQIDVKDKTGKVVENVFLEARNKTKMLISSAISDTNGSGKLILPEGDYELMISKIGHDTLRRSVSINSDDQKITFNLRPVSVIAFDISDSDDNTMPVKIEFRGIKGTADPFLGPVTRSNGNQQLFYTKDRNPSISIPEGNYEIIVSHGPEYHVSINEVKITSGDTSKISVKLKRAFSSPNYIIGDLHNHTTRSGDSNSGVDDRVINMAAAGIEFAPATEHNRISSYSETIRDLGLQKFIASAAGIELSGRPGPGETNHQIGFPLKIQPEKRGYGAPKTDKDPYVQIKRLYDYDEGKFKLMQQNHPQISTLYFDKNKDGIADKGYGTEKFTDVMEIRETMLDLPQAVNGGDANTRSFQWLQMLNLGYRIFGVANSDGHIVGNSSGSVFNYIYTENDQPERIDAVEIAKQVKLGRVIMSNGPFMTVAINGALPGSEIKAEKGKVAVDVEIRAANWCKINTVQILLNGKTNDTLTFTYKSHPALFSKEAFAFKDQIRLILKEDAHIIVLAFGDKESIALMSGKKVMPLALSNPVFVDSGNNGFVPNKDMMGHPLPSDKVSKAEPD